MGGRIMRLLVLLALLLAVLLSLPSALAVRTGAVESQGQIAVVATDSALLSLVPGSGAGNASGTAFYRDPASHDVLLLDFTRGVGTANGYGFPPNSLAYRDRFRYRGLFTVTNRSGESLCLSVHVPGGGVPDLAEIRVRTPGDTGTGTQVAGAGGLQVACTTRLASGAAYEVDFWWEITSTGTGLQSFTVRVEGSR